MNVCLQIPTWKLSVVNLMEGYVSMLFGQGRIRLDILLSRSRQAN